VLDRGSMGFWPTKYHTPHLVHLVKATRVFVRTPSSLPLSRTDSPPPLELPVALGHFSLALTRLPVHHQPFDRCAPPEQVSRAGLGLRRPRAQPCFESSGGGVAISALELPV